MRLIAAAMGSLLLLAGCMPGGMAPDGSGQAAPEGMEPPVPNLLQLQKPKEGQKTAVVTTKHGEMTILLYPEQAPKTTAHFIKLVEQGFYNEKPIFMQDGLRAMVSGASNENGSKGELVTEDGKPLETEASVDLWHFSGALSVLADEKGFFSKRYEADSRFFILGDIPSTTEIAEEMAKNEFPDSIIDAYKIRGGRPDFTGKYTVFGQVIHGMDVLKTITELPADSKTGHPTDGTVIEKIEISAYKDGDPSDFTFSDPAPAPESTPEETSSGE